MLWQTPFRCLFFVLRIKQRSMIISGGDIIISKIKLLGRQHQIQMGRGIYIIVFLCILVLWVISVLPVLYYLLQYYFDVLNNKILKLFVSVMILTFSLHVSKSLDLGFKRLFIKKAEGINTSKNDLFYYFRFKEFAKVLLYFTRIIIFKGFVFFICFLPFFAVICFLSSLIKNVSVVSGLIFVLTALVNFINGAYFYKHFSYSLFLCDYYFVCGKFINFSHLIASSQSTMKNKCKELLKMKISFCGWFLLCALVVPILFVFLYYNQTKAVLALEYINE